MNINSVKLGGVGKGLDESKCVPYISQYSDCSAANACAGCTRCTCNAAGQWKCQRAFECPEGQGRDLVDDLVLDNALDNLFEKKRPRQAPGSLVPPPPNPEDDLLLVPEKKFDFQEELSLLLGREKRSVNEDDSNSTVKFYDTVDEINKDTLKNFNYTGTLEAQKINVAERRKISRRKNILDNNNTSDLSALHIEYSQPHELEHHIAENKVDSKHPIEDKINGLSHEEIHKILGNYSQTVKDKDLSKLVVNELKRGSEIIGDKYAIPVSNITFTPENDTLTAMTFIAGNLLNKLWDMEKDVDDEFSETEVMKREKINSLLELFKEPLSLRQEIFLKNALEKLSRVIDDNDDTKNMSICASFEGTEISQPDNNNCTKTSEYAQQNNMNPLNINNKTASLDLKDRTNTINKINEVLRLMNKYEKLENNLNNLKKLPESQVRKSTNPVEKDVSLNENISLNLFGTLLRKITNLLIPHKSNKKINKKIQTVNLLRKDDIAKKNIEKLFNIDFVNISMSTKDKMVMDYLSNIEKHPNCFFSHLQTPVVASLSNVEGSILYNLSEFFKIKSFADLMKLLNEKPDPTKISNTTPTTSSNHPSTTKQSPITNATSLRSYSKIKASNLENAKEKLKNDIKTILQDLLELQKEHGIKTKSNINISDALPCIYNILNFDPSKENLKMDVANSPTNKIRSFIDSLKFDMKFMSSSRRSNINIIARPKSAVVWERAITNLDKLHKPISRRNYDQHPKSYTDLREMMEKAELSSNTYKNKIIQSGVTPSERLILLKALQADVKQYTDVLDQIKQSFETITNLPLEKQNEFLEFINNAAMNINLNKKVVDLVEKFKRDSSAIQNIKPKVRMVTESKQSLKMPKWVNSNESNDFKLKREQIMKQLIINRLSLYIKTKERTEVDVNADVNYNIAKRILVNLEIGNVDLAKELYKVFVASKDQQLTRRRNTFADTPFPDVYKKEESTGPKLIAFKEPLVRVDNADKIKMLSQHDFMKQIWNLKELKE